MDNNQRFLLQNKIPINPSNIPTNMILPNKYSDQNKNLNESMITTSTSSLSVNNKKNLQNYKTPKKKIFPIPMPKPKNSKQNNSKNLNTLNAIIYTKGTIKKSNPNNNNVFIYNNNAINNNKNVFINKSSLTRKKKEHNKFCS